MKKVIFFIDGFNLYHSLDFDPDFHKYKWLDLRKLCGCFISGLEQICEIYYFTAIATYIPDKAARHTLYIAALKNSGINVVEGKFKRKDRKCKICRNKYISHEEKQTDINIAIHILGCAVDDKFEKAFLISGDSDLVPALSEVRNRFPTKEIVSVFPKNRKSKEIQKMCTSHIKISEDHLSRSLFSDPYTLTDGTVLYCPQTWK